MGIAFHGICPPIFIQTWLHQYCRCTFFHSAHCSLSNIICFWSVWCQRIMIPGKIFAKFSKFQGINCQCEWLQASYLAPWIHWVARSCTTTAYRWLFRDSQLSLGTLWSAVIKSPKLAARGTASPLRLLHVALVILVLWQISQFRSLGKWIWTLCLPKSSRLFVVGSEETSWEDLAWEPPCNGISSSTKFSSQPFRNHTGFPVPSWFPFYLFLGFRWLGFPQVSLIYHQPTQTLALERCHC